MKRVGLLLVCAGAAAVIAPVMARDHGQMGAVWPVIEPDLLQTIGTRLQTMEANGGIARMQETLAARTRARVERPTPVAGITPASEPRQWRFDPSIVVENDIRDQQGRLIAARGTRVNPLGFVAMKTTLVFVDGDDARQLEWAIATWPSAAAAKIILVSGSPFAAMRAHRRRIFFDQQGQLVRRFGIEHTPAIVRADGDRLAIEEKVLAPRGRT